LLRHRRDPVVPIGSELALTRIEHKFPDQSRGVARWRGTGRVHANASSRAEIRRFSSKGVTSR
jgi:hypothetical protein